MDSLCWSPIPLLLTVGYADDLTMATTPHPNIENRNSQIILCNGVSGLANIITLNEHGPNDLYGHL